MIAIVDYGVGNLFSLQSSLDKIGQKAQITSDKAEIMAAERVILPGVGAFGDAAQKLKASGIGAMIKQFAESGRPVLGICLGMQLLFERSFEYGEHGGLSLLKGEVVPLKGQIGGLRIPHMGWNGLHFTRKSALFKYVEEGDYVYFVHSFHAQRCEDSLIATTEYGLPVTAAVGRGNVYGTQFHPEKSGETGLKILKAFAEL